MKSRERLERFRGKQFILMVYTVLRRHWPEFGPMLEHISDHRRRRTYRVKEDNMRFFKNLKNTNSAPLNNYAEFHYADNDGENGFIILTRRMKQLDTEQEFTFNIQWKKKNGHWKIVRETVYIR